MSNERKAEIIKMLEEQPQDSFLRYALACEQEKDGELTRAVDTLASLQKDDPDYYGLYYKLGQLHELNSAPEKAQAAYEAGILVCERLGQFKIRNELEQALWLMD